MNLKEKIIHESLKLFSLKGFLSTSLQDILEAAHTSKGGFYNHFGSKEDLFLAVLSKAQRIWRERNLTDLDEVDSPVNKIKKLLENYRDKYLKIIRETLKTQRPSPEAVFLSPFPWNWTINGLIYPKKLTKDL